ncbi:MAG: neutral zinc metallopeptidase, partial [Pseudomonadota bacterium]
MRWKGRRQSRNVEDRRGMTRGRGMAVGGIGSIIMALIAVFVLGKDPVQVLTQMTSQSGGASQGAAQPRSAQENEAAEFVSVTLADTEEVWHALFQQAGSRYKEPGLVL